MVVIDACSLCVGADPVVCVREREREKLTKCADRFSFVLLNKCIPEVVRC